MDGYGQRFAHCSCYGHWSHEQQLFLINAIIPLRKKFTWAVIYECNVGGYATKTWGISSIFGSRASSGERQASSSLSENVPFMEQTPSTIQLREVIVLFTDVYLWISNLLFIIYLLIFQFLSFSSLCHWFQPPSTLRPLEMTEHDEVVIIATKLLLRSYYDIVRKNIQDLVPKAIMHFLVTPLPS